MKKILLFAATALSLVTLASCSSNPSSESSPSSSVKLVERADDPQFTAFMSELDQAIQQLKDYDSKYDSLNSQEKITALTKIIEIETDMLIKTQNFRDNVELSEADTKSLDNKIKELHIVEQSLSKKSQQ